MRYFILSAYSIFPLSGKSVNSHTEQMTVFDGFRLNGFGIWHNVQWIWFKINKGKLFHFIEALGIRKFNLIIIIQKWFNLTPRITGQRVTSLIDFDFLKISQQLCSSITHSDCRFWWPLLWFCAYFDYHFSPCGHRIRNAYYVCIKHTTFCHCFIPIIQGIKLFWIWLTHKESLQYLPLFPDISTNTTTLDTSDKSHFRGSQFASILM